jgi:hypothetical protein
MALEDRSQPERPSAESTRAGASNGREADGSAGANQRRRERDRGRKPEAQGRERKRGRKPKAQGARSRTQTGGARQGAQTRAQTGGARQRAQALGRAPPDAGRLREAIAAPAQRWTGHTLAPVYHKTSLSCGTPSGSMMHHITHSPRQNKQETWTGRRARASAWGPLFFRGGEGRRWVRINGTFLSRYVARKGAMPNKKTAHKRSGTNGDAIGRERSRGWGRGGIGRRIRTRRNVCTLWGWRIAWVTQAL